MQGFRDEVLGDPNTCVGFVSTIVSFFYDFDHQTRRKSRITLKTEIKLEVLTVVLITTVELNSWSPRSDNNRSPMYSSVR